MKLFQQKKRNSHPLLEPLIQKIVRKILDARIIYLMRHIIWVTNLDLVEKKSGEIRPCVDFRNVNKFSRKYNYPLPSIDQIL